MAKQNFAGLIARERERLRAAREEIFDQQQELQGKLDELSREFAAIDAYEAAKTGKAVRQATARSTARPARQQTRAVARTDPAKP